MCGCAIVKHACRPDSFILLTTKECAIWKREQYKNKDEIRFKVYVACVDIRHLELSFVELYQEFNLKRNITVNCQAYLYNSSCKE